VYVEDRKQAFAMPGIVEKEEEYLYRPLWRKERFVSFI
jgi:hypothetical protein